ncbi:MAG: hypothetical protein WB817_13375 [Terriglobales bacterium]
MVVTCGQVWREISNYLEDDVDTTLRAAMDAHFHQCDRCCSVLEGTRNVIQLYGDERMNEVPLGFGNRLRRRLEESLQPTRRSFMGWIVAAATVVLVGGVVELGRYSYYTRPQQRSKMAEPGSSVPPDMMVVVSKEGKLFHVAGCPFIQDKAHLRTVAAREAMKEGYTPCTRCLKKYLRAELGSPKYIPDRRA